MLNRVILIGRLTGEPSLRYTPAGVAVTTFTLAVDGYKDHTDFIPIVVWRGLAEIVANYAKKGSLVAVSGRIQTRNYENNEGRKVYVTEVVADEFKLLEKKPTEQQQAENRQESRSAGRRNEHDPFSDDGKPIDISGEDLPF